MTPCELEHSLTIPERDELLQVLDRDGFVLLPQKLPAWMIEEANEFLDNVVREDRKVRPDETVFHRINIVEQHTVFRHILMYKPSLQLTYDCLGPEFVLSQDQVWIKTPENPEHPLGSVGWHSDGPANFPQVDGRCPMHTVRFGYMLSDALTDDTGAIDVIRGSHKKRVLHARDTLHWQPYTGARPEDFTQDLVRVRGEAGTIYAFHNAIWHSAQPNRSTTERRIAYFQYTPSWMRPHHRNDPTMYDLQTYTPEERWLLGEPRRANSWMVGDDLDHQRLARFSREAG